MADAQQSPPFPSSNSLDVLPWNDDCRIDFPVIVPIPKGTFQVQFELHLVLTLIIFFFDYVFIACEKKILQLSPPSYASIADRKVLLHCVEHSALRFSQHLDNRDTIFNIQYALSFDKNAKRLDPRIRARRVCKLCLEHVRTICLAFYSFFDMCLGNS
jgi:hypothetical protein